MNVESVILILEMIVTLLMLGYFIYAMSLAFKWKGFLISVLGIASIYLFVVKFENFLNWALEFAPVLILFFLFAIAIILIFITIIDLRKKFGTSKKGIKLRNKYIKDSFKLVFMALFVGFLIFGIILFFVIASSEF